MHGPLNVKKGSSSVLATNVQAVPLNMHEDTPGSRRIAQIIRKFGDRQRRVVSLKTRSFHHLINKAPTDH